MKNALLALTLFAFVGSAAAHEGHDAAKGKKGKKAAVTTHCAKEGTASCCMKKGAKATATAAPAAAPVKSL